MNNLYYKVENWGSSTEVPVLLLHGFLESSTMWNHVTFPENYPMVMIDLPGHGKSIGTEMSIDSMEQIAIAVIRILDELQLTQFHIIGHSMGGYVGLEIAKNDPRAKKIMLLNSNFWSDSLQKVKDRIRVAHIVQTNKSHFIYEVIPNLFQNPEAHDEEVKFLISEAMEMTSDAIAQSSIAMSKRNDFTEFLCENSLKFTCVQGIEDRIVPLKQMRKLLNGTQAKLIELDGVGHMAHFEASEKLTNSIKEFLS